ncbi:hypothetical protein B5S28_g2024 [[Candida] boidinii]|nr:hypothetical protein B5S28_g2024 [[Candida] boidinii]OWB71721.1 hypothetical protein B5S31_g1414 [[Candida] boidinii]
MSTEDVVDHNLLRPVSLKSVQVVGGDEFSDNFYSKLLNPLLLTSDITLGQLLDSCNKVYNNLSYTNVFNDIQFKLEKSTEPSTSEPLYSSVNSNEKVLNINADVIVSPKKLSNFNIGSTHSTDGHLFNFGYTNLNTFGNAESLSLQGLLNPLNENSKTLNFNYKAPMVDTSLKLFANGLILSSKQPWASHHLLATSGAFGLEKTHYVSACCGHNFSVATVAGISLSRRSVLDINDSASDTVKNFAGDSLKESVLLSGSIDSRKFLPSSLGLFPLSGFLLKVDSEIAGLSNVSTEKFIKSTLTYQLFKSFLWNWFTFESTFKVGTISGLSKSSASSSVHFQDKFYLGGNDLNGFVNNSVGLKDGQDYIGGNVLFKYAFGLYSKCLFAPTSAPLRLAFRVQGGDIYQSTSDIDYSSGNFVKNSASSASVGVLYQAGENAALDLHYAVPLSDRSDDIVRPGFGLDVTITSTI